MPRVEMRRILGIRDAVFVLNCVTRKNLKQKYPSGQIMSEHVFLDLGEFEKNRRSAMTEGMRHVRYAKIDRDLLKKLRYEDNLTFRKIGAIVGHSATTVRLHLWTIEQEDRDAKNKN